MLEVDPPVESDAESFKIFDGFESTLSIYQPSESSPEEYPLWEQSRGATYPSPKVLLLRLTSTPESGSRVVLNVTNPAAGLVKRCSHRLRAAYEPCGLEFFATFVMSAAGVGIMIVGGVTALIAAHVRRSRRKTLAGS